MDSLAESHQRGRSYVINEAVAQYLSLRSYHRELIEERWQQDEVEEMLDLRDVRAMVAGWASTGDAQ